MKILDKIYFKINEKRKKIIGLLYQRYAEFHLKNIDFCIICNNCYGGHLYEAVNRPYNTPTVGLYFFAEDYLKFVSNLESYLLEDLSFISKSRYDDCLLEHNKKKYPIGLLSNNLEIHFLHYNSEEEARSKWNRRKARVNKDNLVVIMNDQNNFDDKLMSKFDSIPYSKVFLSAKKRDGQNVKYISYYKNKENVGDMYNDKLKSFSDFDLVKWIKQQKQ